MLFSPTTMVVWSLLICYGRRRKHGVSLSLPTSLDVDMVWGSDSQRKAASALEPYGGQTASPPQCVKPTTS